MPKKFPSEVFVKWEEYENDTPLLVVIDRPDDAVDVGQKAMVARFKLVELLKVEGIARIAAAPSRPSRNRKSASGHRK